MSCSQATVKTVLNVVPLHLTTCLDGNVRLLVVDELVLNVDEI